MVMRKKLQASILVATLAATLAVPAARADQLSDEILDENNVSAGAMILDAFIARPAMLFATAGGTALFAASAPFTLVGGNVGHAWDTLVVAPAEMTFVRCLGCTPVQDARLRADRESASAAAAPAPAAN